MIRMREMLQQRDQLQKFADEDDFPSAIFAYQQLKKLMGISVTILIKAVYSEFKSVKELSQSTQEIYLVVQLRLDHSLTQTLQQFNPDYYGRILQAYRLLGQANKVTEKIRLHFLETVTTNSKDLINAHVVMSEENASQLEKLKK